MTRDEIKAEIDGLDEAIALATEYRETHLFTDKMTDERKKRRQSASEAIRLGGMTKILHALQAAKAYRSREAQGGGDA